MVQTTLPLNRIVRRAEYLMPISNSYKFYAEYLMPISNGYKFYAEYLMPISNSYKFYAEYLMPISNSYKFYCVYAHWFFYFWTRALPYSSIKGPRCQKGA